MMATMPMPYGLTLFMLVGNHAAMLSGNIVTSLQDHVSSSYQGAASCVALVDGDFDQEQAIVEDVLYSYANTELEPTAIGIALKEIHRIAAALSDKGANHIGLNHVNCILIVDANGTISLDSVTKIAGLLKSECSGIGIQCDPYLCLLTNFSRAGNQSKWLMRDGVPAPEINVFRKMLLLSNKNLTGGIGQRVEQSMRDAVLPALLMMLSSHEQDNPTRLYTASYNKEGGTSNDILELKRHIAAEVLDGFFARSDAVSANEVWRLLSTPSIVLTNDGAPAARIRKAAADWSPQLECIAANANLEDKDFNPISHVMSFDDMNRDAMCETSTLPDVWLNDVKSNLRELLYPDAVLEQLDENGIITRDILTTWREMSQRNKLLVDRKYTELQLNCSDAKRGIFKKVYDHNLQLLNSTVSLYQNICQERIAYRLLTCFQQRLPEVRQELRRMIALRRDTLAAYRQSEEKISMLTDKSMCQHAAAELQNNYARPDSVQSLVSFMSESEHLYSAHGAHYWRKLFREFTDQYGKTGSFTEAFMKGKDSAGLQKSVIMLENGQSALIPDYPATYSALSNSSEAFLLNNYVAKALPSQMNTSVVYGVPGDLLEHIAIYRLCDDFSLLSDLKLFAAGTCPVIPSNDGYWNAKVHRKRPSASAEYVDSPDQNPWNLRLKVDHDGVLVAWDYPQSHADTTILVNNEVCQTHYTFAQYKNAGMTYRLPNASLPSGSITVTLECDDEQYSCFLDRPLERVTVALSPSRVKAKITAPNYVELQRFTAHADLNANGKCIVLQDHPQVFRLELPINDHMVIGPLWLPEGSYEIQLEDKPKMKNR